MPSQAAATRSSPVPMPRVGPHVVVAGRELPAARQRPPVLGVGERRGAHLVEQAGELLVGRASQRDEHAVTLPQTAVRASAGGAAEVVRRPAVWSVGMKCPVCDVALSISSREGVEIDFCPQCRGVWLDRGELDKVIERAAASLAPATAAVGGDRGRDDRYDDRPRYDDVRRTTTTGATTTGDDDRRYDDRPLQEEEAPVVPRRPLRVRLTHHQGAGTRSTTEDDHVPGGIKAHGLVKRYGDVTALDGLDLSVPEGTVLGLLGPNGAGKTTAVRIFTTLLEPDDGDGHGRRHRRDRRPATGCASASGCRGRTPPSTSTSPASRTSTWSAGCTTWAGHRPRERARELLDAVRAGRRRRPPRQTYSGGMRRRLDLAAALVAEPPSCSSTSRPPVSTRAAASTCGRSSATWSRAAPRCCSPPSTSRRPTAWPTTSSSSTSGTGDRPGHGRRAQEPGRRRAHRARRGPLRRPRRGPAGAGRQRLRRDRRRRAHRARWSRRSSGGAATLRSAARRPRRRTALDVLDVGLRRPTLDDVFLTLTGHAAEAREDADGSDDETTSEEVA